MLVHIMARNKSHDIMWVEPIRSLSVRKDGLRECTVRSGAVRICPKHDVKKMVDLSFNGKSFLIVPYT
jgi:hypothetical protein